MADSSTVNSNNNNAAQQKTMVHHSSFGFMVSGPSWFIEAARATDEQMAAAILNGQKTE